MQSNTRPHITRVPPWNSKSISKTRIIDITINYIAIGMKAQVQTVLKDTSRWLSRQTTSMILLQDHPIKIVAEGLLLRGFTQTEGLRAQIIVSY
jgi:hypothetical protein